MQGNRIEGGNVPKPAKKGKSRETDKHFKDKNRRRGKDVREGEKRDSKRRGKGNGEGNNS